MTKNILIYDVSALPRGKRMIDIKKEYEENGIVMWASAASDNMASKHITDPPRVIDRKTLDDAKGIKFVDISEEKI